MAIPRSHLYRVGSGHGEEDPENGNPPVTVEPEGEEGLVEALRGDRSYSKPRCRSCKKDCVAP